MFLQVGGIFLRVIDSLTQFTRENVWSEDGTSLHGIDITLGCAATYAPGGLPRLNSALITSPVTDAALDGSDATAAVLARNPRGAPPVFPTPVLEADTLIGGARAPDNLLRTGPETDAELNLLLMQPRQKLILWAYARQSGLPIRWLESPRPGFDIDLDNGPHPISCDVISASGEPNSIAVHYQTRTRISPCPSGADKLVLSHRWQMRHAPDENQYLSRIVEGTVKFNPAAMGKLKLEPDWFRNQFIHPIPVGMKRAAPVVTLSSDNTVLKYTVVDTDPTITFDPGNSAATLMDIQERTVYNVPTSTQR